MCHVKMMNFTAANRSLNNWKDNLTNTNDTKSKDWMFYGLKVAMGLGIRISIEKSRDLLEENLPELSNEQLVNEAKLL